MKARRILGYLFQWSMQEKIMGWIRTEAMEVPILLRSLNYIGILSLKVISNLSTCLYFHILACLLKKSPILPSFLFSHSSSRQSLLHMAFSKQNWITSFPEL